jgi:hypothetical protein
MKRPHYRGFKATCNRKSEVARALVAVVSLARLKHLVNQSRHGLFREPGFYRHRTKWFNSLRGELALIESLSTSQ